MIEENNKPTEDISEKKEEKEFLSRQEVKTMDKDVSRLRERQSRQERNRVARMRTEEEMQIENERRERSKRAAIEREAAQKNTIEKEEELKRLKKQREVRESIMRQDESARGVAKAESFKGSMETTQSKEEAERKRFMERVQAKSEGREEQPIMPQKPPVQPTQEPPHIKAANVSAPIIKKPNLIQKLWIRIVLAFLVLAVLAGIGTLIYWLVVERGSPEDIAPPVEQETLKELIPPTSLVPVDDYIIMKATSLTDVPYLVFDAVKDGLNDGSFTRIIIENMGKNEILGVEDFFESMPITSPNGFYDKLENDFTLFVNSQEEGNRIGFIVKIKDEEGLSELLSSWEETMENDFEAFFGLLGKEEPAMVSYFKGSTYEEIDFRFQTFSRQDLGIVYSIYNGYFILTTSWKSMEKTLDKLKDISVSFFYSPESGAEFFLEKLTMEEKVGQLFLIGIEGTTLTPLTEQLVKDIGPGGILLLKKNIENKTQTQELIQGLQKISLETTGIPLLIAVDQEGGEIATINFGKEKTAQSEIKDQTQAYAIGLSRGEELRDIGINLNLAPVLDVTNPEDFLYGRSFQKNQEEMSVLAKALISGQKEASILTAIKHFPGYGDILSNPEKELFVMEDLPELSHFQTVMEAKPELVMVSNVVYSELDPDLPFTLSPKSIQLLKENLGDECVIITDDLPQDHLLSRFSLKGIVTLPVLAGVDILTFSGWSDTASSAAQILCEAVENNEITEARIDQSVLKIIKLKKSLLQ